MGTLCALAVNHTEASCIVPVALVVLKPHPGMHAGELEEERVESDVMGPEHSLSLVASSHGVLQAVVSALLELTSPA